MPEYEEVKNELALRQFERNKYFYGKLMTVRDFELEQEYFNGKRHLLNRLTHGKGLLCGFSNIELLQNSDEVSVWFRDGGVALDSLGREIVVPVDMKKKVLTEDGGPIKRSAFKDLTNLYLRYSPAVTDLVRAASSPLSCEEVTYPNRVLEDFEVFASSVVPEEAKAHEVHFVTIKAVNEVLSISKGSHLRTQVSMESITTGVVYFKQPTVNSITSSPIDPKMANTDDPIFIQLFPEEVEESKILTVHSSSKRKDEFPFQLRTIFDRSSGTFKVQLVFRDESERRSVRVRWWAFKADKDYGTEEVKSGVFLTKYKFLSDPDPEIKKQIVENGLCESGAKNYMKDGIILGGNYYARVGNEVALNGNPKKLTELIKEQDGEPKEVFSEWDIGGGWLLRIENFYNTSENFYNTSKKPTADIKLYFEKQELKTFLGVSEGNLITYCEDIEGEKNVPLFVTYIDDIYIPVIRSLIGKEAKIVLKYTWVVSKNIRYTESKIMEKKGNDNGN
jgi:hypothetical protein